MSRWWRSKWIVSAPEDRRAEDEDTDERIFIVVISNHRALTFYLDASHLWGGLGIQAFRSTIYVVSYICVVVIVIGIESGTNRHVIVDIVSSLDQISVLSW